MSTLAALTLTYLMNGSSETIQVELTSEQACIAAAHEKIEQLHQQGAQAAWTCESKTVFKSTAYSPSAYSPATKHTELAFVTHTLTNN